MCVRAGSVAHPGNYAHWSAFRILAAWPHPPKPLTPNVGVTAATNLFIWTLANEDRAVCRSPRGEGSPSAFCGGRDGDYADRVFAFDDLVLSALLKQQSRRRYAANGLPSSPTRAVFLDWKSNVARRHKANNLVQLTVRQATVWRLQSIPDDCLTNGIFGFDYGLRRYRIPVSVDGNPILTLPDVVASAVTISVRATRNPLG
jgi:hypothetical protein